MLAKYVLAQSCRPPLPAAFPTETLIRAAGDALVLVVVHSQQRALPLPLNAFRLSRRSKNAPLGRQHQYCRETAGTTAAAARAAPETAGSDAERRSARGADGRRRPSARVLGWPRLLPSSLSILSRAPAPSTLWSGRRTSSLLRAADELLNMPVSKRTHNSCASPAHHPSRPQVATAQFDAVGGIAGALRPVPREHGTQSTPRVSS